MESSLSAQFFHSDAPQNEQMKKRERVFMEKKKANGFALIPIIVFLLLYVGSGIYFQYVKGQDQGFYVMSVVVAFTIAIIVALVQNRETDCNAKLK